MRRLTLAALLLTLPVLASAQMPGGMNFITTANQVVVKPGTTFTLTATFTHSTQMPMQIADDALFVLGLRYRTPGPYGMFVDPLVPLGFGKFTVTQQGGLVVRTAKFNVTVPNVTLPPNFSTMFYCQALTLVKPRMWPQPRVMPSVAAPVVLVAP